MISYLVKIFILLAFSFFVIYNYYFWAWSHVENFDWYLPYIIIMWIIYGIYKFLQLDLLAQKQSFSLLRIIWFFFLHLFVLCLLYFSFNDIPLSNWLLLFWKIVFYLLLPTLILFIAYWFWKKISSCINYLEQDNKTYNFLLSLALWFFSFVFLITTIGILGFYNIWVVLLILGGFIAYSYKEIIAAFNWVTDYSIELDVTEWNYMKLISSELLFIISTLIISTTLINIIRPFPIWWDDLWAYMNYPHLFAEAGSIISIWWMRSWEVFTGIGYIFSWPTQAFFLNSIWGILSFIVLILVIGDLIKTTSPNKKSFFNVPMLLATIFISMPMVVFQQAKDMKLDAWLFFLSVITLYLLFKYYLNKQKYENLEMKKWWGILFVVWLLLWFAFTIKFTSLLLISWALALVFFSRLWFAWLIWYISIYFAIFTKADLWKKMNVVVNPDKIPWFETKFAIIFWLLWLWFIAYQFLKTEKSTINRFLKELAIIFVWIIIAILPWWVKNIVSSYPDIWVSAVLSWKSESFVMDKTLLKTSEELQKIEEEKKAQRLASDGTIWNEDWWRYLGYEKWINNYIKLPWNLTMQVNQKGEFTDIWFIFLALLPVILLFLPYRKKNYAFLIVIFLLLELLIFVKSEAKPINISNLSAINQETKDFLFDKNNKVFKDKTNNKDIYDIDFFSYVSKDDLKKLAWEDNTYETLEKKSKELFYKQIRAKVESESIEKKITLTNTDLYDKDYEYLKELKSIRDSSYYFSSKVTSLHVLEWLIKEYEIKDWQALINLWKENRSFNQLLSDNFAKYSLPWGYLVILILFLLPVLFIFLGLKRDDVEENIELFKLNTVFVSFYTFLWVISAFWVVWYGITMYFSFLLAIGVALYYTSSYNSTDDENSILLKKLASISIGIVFLIYICFSIIPHTFSNFKAASYNKYKMWNVTQASAPFVYHKEYLKILFELNIAEDKKEKFLETYIDKDIIARLPDIVTMDIEEIKIILNEAIKNNNKLSGQAESSLENIYKNISNPDNEFKNKSIIFRAWTFLKYHISENNKRLIEDSLLFSFNDYIHDTDIFKTIENFKKLWVSHLLVDLNAATIDRDKRHNLTKRYEKLLTTFTADDLELISTDSKCLKVAYEDYKKSEKNSHDLSQFITIAWVNYESYQADGTQVARWAKLMNCYKLINKYFKEKKVDKDNYPYLLNIYNHIEHNKKDYDTDNKVYKLLQDQVKHWYKALFKVK